MNVQRIVEDSPAIDLQGEAQHAHGEIETPPKYTIKFDQVKHFLKTSLTINFEQQIFFSELALPAKKYFLYGKKTILHLTYP
jgi:hypothetical protein